MIGDYPSLLRAAGHVSGSCGKLTSYTARGAHLWRRVRRSV